MKHIQEFESLLFRAKFMTLEKTTVSGNKLSYSRDHGIYHRVLEVTASPQSSYSSRDNPCEYGMLM